MTSSKGTNGGNSWWTSSRLPSTCRGLAWTVPCRTRSCFWTQFCGKRSRISCNTSRSSRRLFVHLRRMFNLDQNLIFYSNAIPLVLSLACQRTGSHFGSPSSPQFWVDRQSGSLGMEKLRFAGSRLESRASRSPPIRFTRLVCLGTSPIISLF